MQTLGAALLALSAWAQTTPQFEVATVKASPPPTGRGPVAIGTRGGPGTQDPERFSCLRCTLASLISTAYNVNGMQISGPDFLTGDMFEIVAKVPAGATREQLREMVKNLLVERFKMTAHMETKDVPIYELVVTKGGAKLKDSEGQADLPDAPGRRGAAPAPPPGPERLKMGSDGIPALPPGRRPMMIMMPGKARWRQVDVSMADFAKQLQNQVGRPVNDATGLKGKYDFELTFAPDFSVMGRGRGVMFIAPGGPPPGAAPGGDASTPDESAPSIFTAIQEQLGLKLESKKGPVEMVVVEKIEKTPTEN